MALDLKLVPVVPEKKGYSQVLRVGQWTCTSRTGVGKICPVGWIRPAKGFYLARGGSLSPAWLRGSPSHGICGWSCHPQVRSRARVAWQLDSTSWQPWRWWLLLAATVAIATSPSPTAWASQPIHPAPTCWTEWASGVSMEICLGLLGAGHA